MSEHMVKPPSIFLFVDGQYDGLFKSERWRIDIVSADADRARSLKSTVEEDRLKGNLQNADFVSLQENEALQTLYDGNSFDAAFIALRRTDDHPAMTLECEFNWEQYLVELEICQKRSYPTLKNAEAPSDIAGLARKQPWEYGVLSSDQSQYADTAYPMSLTFRPMAALSMANKFLPDSTALSVSDIATTYEYAAAIIQVKVRSLSQLNVKSARELRENVGLQDVDGLCELSILTNADDRDNVCFLTGMCTQSIPSTKLILIFEVWKSAKDLAIYRQKHTANQYTGHDIVSSCTVTHDWTSNAIGLQQLEWESSHMVVDKILELVEFRFAKALKLTEKKAFMYRIYDLIK
jgi:phage gp37-like protein